MDLVESILTEAGRTGGWAAMLLALMIIVAGYFTYILARHVIDDQMAQNRKTLDEMRSDYAVQLERERSISDRYDSTLQTVNETFGKVGEIMRQTNATLDGTRHALDRNSDLLEQFTRRYWNGGQH